MENIEQLQQENAKLQERLNNAAKFFREQKAQIEALIKENEELKRTPKKEVIDVEKWNKLVSEKVTLDKQIEEYELKLQNLESNIDSKDKAYKVLQDTYNEVFADYNKLKGEISQIDKLQNTIKTYERKIDELENNNPEVQKLEEKLQALQETHDDLGVDYDKLNGKYNESIKAFEEQKIQIETLKKKFEEEEQNAFSKKLLLDEANEKIIKLNELYDNCENEKSAIQNDYNNLNDEYTLLKNEYANVKIELNNDDICRYNKKEINDLCDYILDFFKDNNLNNKK